MSNPVGKNASDAQKALQASGRTNVREESKQESHSPQTAPKKGPKEEVYDPEFEALFAQAQQATKEKQAATAKVKQGEAAVAAHRNAGNAYMDQARKIIEENARKADKLASSLKVR